jgi:hypothetical protein
MAEHPTLLRRPDSDPILSRVEDFLPGAPEDYAVNSIDDVWVVVAIATQVVVYRGPGPVEVLRSPAPF